MNTLPNQSDDFAHWDETDFEKIKIDVVSHTTGNSVPSIYRKVALGKFPPPVEPGTWFRGQIRDHKRALARAAMQKQARLSAKNTAT